MSALRPWVHCVSRDLNAPQTAMTLGGVLLVTCIGFALAGNWWHAGFDGVLATGCLVRYVQLRRRTFTITFNKRDLVWARASAEQLDRIHRDREDES